MSGFCFWLFRFLSVRCEAVVTSQGSVFVFWSVEPFTTRPLFGFYLPVFFFSCMVCSSTPCAFFFSLSLRRWGTPNLFGLGFPLCSRGHDLLLRPVLRGRHLHQGFHPHLFFFSTSLVFLVVFVVFDLGLSLSLSISLYLSLSLSVVWLLWVIACTWKSERGGGL